MDEMSAFERQLATGLSHMAGPGRAVDAVAVARAAASRSQKWRVPSMFRAVKLVVAGAIVALFAGVLAAGVPPSPERRADPAAMTTTGPSATGASPSVVPDASAAALSTSQPRYEATARLIVGPGPDPNLEDLAVAEAAVARYAAMSETRDVAEAVIAQLDLDESPEHLLGRIAAEASGQTLVLSLRVSDGDREAALLLAETLGDEMRQRVLDLLITDEVREADLAIASARSSLRALQARFDQLRRKAKKTQLERNELILLAGQISGIQQAIQELRPSSSTSLRNRLDWLEQPTVSETSGPDRWQGSAIPTVQVLVADAPIDQGTTIVPDMVTLLTVSPDATNEMAFTDVASAVGRVVAIDVLANQPITPNMLVDE